MLTLLASDIFGCTPALQRLASRLAGPIKIIDPYQGEFMRFRNEAQAYTTFCDRGGLARYSQQLCMDVQALSEPIFLIGFSVGAAAIWRASYHGSLARVRAAVGFYGSQIRHYTTITPAFPMTLIFPEHEEAFPVSALLSTLQATPNVRLLQTTMQHGFMNIHSNNFNPHGYEQYLCALARQTLYLANSTQANTQREFFVG